MKISLEERKNLHKLCFQDSDTYTDGFFEHFYQPKKSTDLIRDGRLAATLYVKKQTLYFGKFHVDYDFITGLCVHPDFRKKGLAAALLDKYFSKTDAAFAALHPFDRGFYQKQGFVPYSFASEDNAKATGLPLQTLRITDKGHIAAVVDTVVKRRKQNPFPFVPVVKELRDLLREIELEFLDGAEFYAIAANGVTEGYAVINDEEVLMYEFLNRRNINDVAEFKNLKFYQSPLSNTVFNMARVADVEKLLYSVPYAVDERTKFDFHLTDERTPRNNGSIRIVCERSKCLAVIRMPERNSLPTVSAEQLTLLALGQPDQTPVPKDLKKMFLSFRIEDRNRY